MRTQISKRKLAALTFREVLMMLAALVGLALVLSLATFRSKRAETHRISCIAHLKFIGMDLRAWGFDHGDKFPMQLSFTNGGTLEAGFAYQHFSVVSNELFSPTMLLCAAQMQTAATNFGPGLNNSHVSYFVGLGADINQPNTFLAGDRNLTLNGTPVGTGPVNLPPQSNVGWTSKLHRNRGNVVLADGSVWSFSQTNLSRALRDSGVATNRLLFP